MSAQPEMMEKLNEDVLSCIIRCLPVRDLRSFALVCRWAREAVAPLLYKHVTLVVIWPNTISDPKKFMPSSLMVHVRSLLIYDCCYLYFPADVESGLCRLYESLANRLRELPNVRSLELTPAVAAGPNQLHALPWNTIRSILSVPHLREFKLTRLYISPTLRPGENFDVESLGPITSFHYQLHHPRDPRSFPLETAALATILEKLCGTLETLALMTESAPLSVMASLKWPRLRKMVFYGTPLPGPFIQACFGMQSLRSLSLKINPDDHGLPPVVWSPSSTSAFPWPKLESLIVSYPDVRDEVYDHLPSTLRSLSLRCWYHQHYQVYLFRLNISGEPLRQYLLRSSEMLSIIRRCSMLTLEHLEVEYAVDNEDDALLQYLAATFPHLESLKIHRYRHTVVEEGEQDVPVKHIAQLLSPLRKLCRLKIFLDWNSHQRTTSTDRVRDAAQAFARSLGHCLRVLLVHDKCDVWREFMVVGDHVLERRNLNA